MKSIHSSQQKPLLLNEFDLSDNNFDASWINNIISKPIAKNVLVQLDNGKMVEHDFYINFDEIVLPQDKDKEKFYKNLNITIKQHISNVWNSSNIHHIYNFYTIEKNKDTVKVIFFYFSNKKSQKILDHSLFKYQDSLIRYIIDLLLKGTLMETLSENSPLRSDLFSGNFFLNPEIREGKKTNTINVFSYFLSYRNETLKFKLENKLFLLAQNPTQYDNICLLNKSFNYSKKLDARKYDRPFISFKNHEKLKASKFITQIEFYKLVDKTLQKFNIKNNKTYFEPTYIYNNFSMIKNSIKEIDMVVIDTNKKYQLERFKNLQNTLLNEHNLKVNLLVNPTLNELSKDKTYLFLQAESDQNNFSFNIEENESWTTAMYPFIQKELYKLSLDEFVASIKSFDLYSQVKLFNLYANYNKLQPFISQGWIIDDYVPLEDPKSTRDYNSDLIVLKKIVNELNLKSSVYLKNKIFLNFNYNFNIDIQKIRVVSTIKAEKDKLFSVIDFIVSNKSEQGIELEIKNSQMLINGEIDSLNLPININNEKDYKDSYLFLNDDYLIKSKDNDLMPFILCKKEIYENRELDIMEQINEKIIMDNSLEAVPKTYENFYPFIMPRNNVMLKLKGEKFDYAGCHIEFKNKEANIFMMLQDWAPKVTIPTNNRIENIQLFKLKDFEYKKVNIEEHQELLQFYLSTLPFNYLSISELSKKSILNKLSEIIVKN